MRHLCFKWLFMLLSGNSSGGNMEKIYLFKPTDSPNFYLQYTLDGKPKQESAHKKTKGEALTYLANRKAELENEAQSAVYLSSFKAR